jgi:hypothetical protein
LGNIDDDDDDDDVVINRTFESNRIHIKISAKESPGH